VEREAYCGDDDFTHMALKLLTTNNIVHFAWDGVQSAVQGRRKKKKTVQTKAGRHPHTAHANNTLSRKQTRQAESLHAAGLWYKNTKTDMLKTEPT
jgi:hypothetical protein